MDYRECASCDRLVRERDRTIDRHIFWNTAHLAAVQRGELRVARGLEKQRLESKFHAIQAEQYLQNHLVTHQAEARTAR